MTNGIIAEWRLTGCSGAPAPGLDGNDDELGAVFQSLTHETRMGVLTSPP